MKREESLQALHFVVVNDPTHDFDLTQEAWIGSQMVAVVYRVGWDEALEWHVSFSQRQKQARNVNFPGRCSRGLRKPSPHFGSPSKTAKPAGWRAKQAEKRKKRERAEKRGREALLGEASLSEKKGTPGGQDKVKPSLTRARWQSLLEYRTV
jgi:hypothetical protein